MSVARSDFEDKDETNDTAPLLTSENESTSQEKNTVMFLASLTMLLGAITTGTMLGLSSPLIPSIRDDTSSNAIHIGDVEASWIGSLLSVGGIIGGLSAGLVMQAVGRKFCSILSTIPYLGGLLLISYAENVAMVYAGRFITGIGVAFTSLVVPTYVGEISTGAYRGLLGSGNQLAITLGILLVYAIGGYFSWRWLALALACIPVVYAILCLFIPETPRHLYMKDKRAESIAVLQRLRGKDANIAEELQQLYECTAANFTEVTWKELVTNRAIRTPLLLSLGTMFFQQFSGINCIMFYSQSIFEEAGYKTPAQLHLSLILIGGIQVLFTLISCVLVDRTGRKILWGVSSTIMSISMIAFGVYFQLKAIGHSSGMTWLALASLMVYMASFAIGLGPLPWLLMVELLPLRAKGKCGGIVTMFNLLSCFVVTKEFHDLQNLITTQGTFWVFGGICFVSLLFGIFLLPETKGRTLEEIQCHFECNHFESNQNAYQQIDGSNSEKDNPFKV